MSILHEYIIYDYLNSFCRTDLKFCSCSDDTTVKVWDFARCQEERSLSGNVLWRLKRMKNIYFFIKVTHALGFEPNTALSIPFYWICSYVWFHLLLKICNGTEQAFVCLRWTYMMHKNASNASFFKFLCILFCVKHSVHQWNK